MGSSESGTGGTAADCGVGSIVWVRRRNGSWWPGKILGSDELSATHVISPRSGTPVKLLGREDASVDWYNLERSKRVKAFRCGEFDDCIERAEASLGMPPKKREKYARREDAILHALELERQTLEKKYGKGHYYNGNSNKSLHDLRNEVLSSEKAENENRKQLHLETEQAQKGLYLSQKDQSEDHGLSSGTKEGNQPGVDDDNSDVLPRMRGLQDFGFGTAATAPSNPSTSPSAPSDLSQKPASDGDCQGTLVTALNTEVTVDGNCQNSSIMSRENWDEDSLAKKRNRHQPLVQVLQNSSKLAVSVSQPVGSMSEEQQVGVPFPAKRSRYTYLVFDSPDALYDTKIHSTRLETLRTKFEESNCMPPADSFEENATESTEDTETDSSETDSLDSDSDSDELATLSEGAASIELEPKYPGLSHARPEYGSGEEVDGLAHTDEVSHPFQNDLESTSGGVSKWQLKGKRNNRSLSKRPPDGTSRSFLRAYPDETAAIKLRTDIRKETYVLEEFKPRIAVRGSRGPDDVAGCRTQWEHWDWNDQPPRKGYWEDSAEYFDPELVSHYRNSGKIMLIDVDLKVQSSYQREHVPMISLMSKINGQAIVGHPIQTEALENGSSESLLAEADDWYPGISDTDTNPPPMWKTARRTTNIRFPHPVVSPRDESGKHLQFVDGRKGSSAKSNSGTFGHRSSTMGKPSSRKPVRKVSTSSNQKIRTLSSISSHQKPSSDPNDSGNNLIKPESAPTAVACIPVKLVFSRLQEELIGRRA